MEKQRKLRFQHVRLSRDIINLIDDETRRIQRHYPQVLTCAVALSKPNRRRHKGDKIRAQVSMTLPGKRLVSTKDADGPSEPVNALAALLDAFDAADRLADTYLQKHRFGNTKRKAFEAVPA